MPGVQLETRGGEWGGCEEGRIRKYLRDGERNGNGCLKGWNRERGGRSRDHKRFLGKKWQIGAGEDETKSSRPRLLEVLRGKKWERSGGPIARVQLRQGGTGMNRDQVTEPSVHLLVLDNRKSPLEPGLL